MNGKTSRTEVVGIAVAMLMLLGTGVGVYGMSTAKNAEQDARILRAEADGRTTAQILARLVPAVAVLEERTKGK